MVKITGADNFTQRLLNMRGRDVKEEIGQALFAAGEIVKAEARVSITTGAVSGKHHIPSLPGHPPLNDTGVLVSHINTIQTGPLRVEVESAAPYAAVLETGSSKMQPRPYMGPALRAKRKEIVGLVQKAVGRALEKRR
jgi:HK97 gp10 family phage protein